MGKLLKNPLKSLPKPPRGHFRRNQDKTAKDTHSDRSQPSSGPYGLFKAHFKLNRNKTASTTVSEPKTAPEPPKLVRRRENRASTFKMGRTIAEKRERLETANERAAARKKDKKRQVLRVLFTTIGFAALAGILITIFVVSFRGGESTPVLVEEPISLTPTIPITDENSGSNGKITSRMSAYVATAERDFRDLGYTPVKAVVPRGAIREVDFYLEGHPGYVKMTIDRDSAVSVEDVDRLYRYLASINVTNFAYIDVRLDGKAYYKPLESPDPAPVEPEPTDAEY